MVNFDLMLCLYVGYLTRLWSVLPSLELHLRLDLGNLSERWSHLRLMHLWPAQPRILQEV